MKPLDAKKSLSKKKIKKTPAIGTPKVLRSVAYLAASSRALHEIPTAAAATP